MLIQALQEMLIGHHSLTKKLLPQKNNQKNGLNSFYLLETPKGTKFVKPGLTMNKPFILVKHLAK